MGASIARAGKARAGSDTGRPTALSARWSYAVLGGGLALALIFFVRMDDPEGSWLFLLGGGYGVLMCCVGASRMPPARRRIWWAIAAGQLLFVAGDSLWALYEDVWHVDPYPSTADVAYLLGYPALALGLMWLVRGRRRGRDRAAFLDAAILTTGFTVLGTAFFVLPAAETGGEGTLQQLVAAAYPAADLLVLAVVIRMFTSGMARNVSLLALVGGLVTLLLTDLYYVTTAIEGAEYPAWLDLGYLLSYLLVGLAALHPAAHSLSEPAPYRPERITALRVMLLGAALMLAPMTDFVAHVVDGPLERDSWVMVIGGCLGVMFVVWRVWDLVRSLQRKAVQLAALARKDGLTGIANRRTWDHELSRACAIARDQGTPLSIAVLDMDHFKQFNDTLGHTMGDLVLKETATAWASILHGRGFIARFGGEEFAVLLPNLTADDAVGMLEQLRATVTHGQTCSIGLAMWDGVESPAHLFARADQAVYHAKHEGRDRIAMHDGSTTSTTTTPREGRAEDVLRPVYQPIVDLATGETVAFEALSRFEYADPQQTFDTAARLGTGPSLEAAAIRKALAGFDGPELLSLNVSLTALLTHQVQEVLPQDLSGVILEITEADLVDYTPEVMLAVENVRARGALLAIDDVGIGFSNIERMVTLKPDIIKLDMSLIRDVDSNPMLQAVVAAAFQFAERTGIKVVAEGIETEWERDCLAIAGVHMGQGFYLGRPQPVLSRTLMT
jgi:diguanylate cyclase